MGCSHQSFPEFQERGLDGVQLNEDNLRAESADDRNLREPIFPGEQSVQEARRVCLEWNDRLDKDGGVGDRQGSRQGLHHGVDVSGGIFYPLKAHTWTSVVHWVMPAAKLMIPVWRACTMRTIVSSLQCERRQKSHRACNKPVVAAETLEGNLEGYRRGNQSLEAGGYARDRGRRQTRDSESGKNEQGAVDLNHL